MTANEKQEKVRAINEEWMGTPEDGGGTIAGDYEKEGWSFYIYEPFAFKNDDGSESVPYWEEKRKIVFCNLNAVGDYTNCTDEFHTFSWDIFQKSIPNERNTLAKTALFCYCLRKRLADESLPSVDAFPGMFNSERSQIDDAMKRVCYMNLDPLIHTGSSWTKPDKTGKSPCWWTWDFYQDSPSAHFNRESQRKLIAALEPDILITTGITDSYEEGQWAGGLDFFNFIYRRDQYYSGEELHLDKEGLQWLETNPGKKTLFVSVQHPSPQNTRFDGKYIVDTVETICRKLSASTVSG